MRAKLFGRVAGMLDPDGYHDGLCDLVVQASSIALLYRRISVNSRTKPSDSTCTARISLRVDVSHQSLKVWYAHDMFGEREHFAGS